MPRIHLYTIPHSHRPRLLIAVPFALLGIGLTGCSLSLPIASLNDKEDGIVTGAVTPNAPSTSNLSSQLSDEDWRRAQAALGVAVDPQGNGAPVSWDNPESGRKGSFVAAGPLYVVDNKVCRSFIATVTAPATNQQLQGSTCRNGPNEWTVRDAKPWKAPG